MKKYTGVLSFAVVFLFALFIGGCKKADSFAACYQTLPTSVSVGTTVAFNPCTEGANYYIWNFGEGTLDTTIYATHTYQTPGTYNGSLTEISGTTPSTKTFSIVVYANTWTVGGNTYLTDSVITSITSQTLTAYDIVGSTEAGITLLFHSLPTTGGSYPIDNFSNGSPPANHLAIILYKYVGTTLTRYGSPGTAPVNATISVIPGRRISVVLPTMYVVNQSNPSDSVTLSGVITQTQ